MQARALIQDLVKLRKEAAVPEVKRDASIAVDIIIQKYGSITPEDFLLPDWKGDFKAIKKRINVASRTNNKIELVKIIKQLNVVITTNADRNVRNDAVETLTEVNGLMPKLLDEFEQHYVEAILIETDRTVQKSLNNLLRSINLPAYYEDFEVTIKHLSTVEKTIKIIPKYDFENDFIRYRIQIQNNTDETLWDVRYQVKKYETFIIREVKPEYDIFEDYTILVSVIQPRDTKEIFIKLEPKTIQLFLEGTLYFRKSNDNSMNTLNAQNLSVDIMSEWPDLEEITPDKVSIIHCRELFDFHVQYKSLNAFALPKSIAPELAYKLGKRVLSDLGFTMVMDVVHQENFYGEALFYGKGKNDEKVDEKQKEIVMVLRCSHENYAIEINIGTNKNSYLVAIQIKFDNLLRQVILSQEQITDTDKLIELRCPACFQAYDSLNREWCPWCGADLPKY